MGTMHEYITPDDGDIPAILAATREEIAYTADFWDRVGDSPQHEDITAIWFRHGLHDGYRDCFMMWALHNL